MAEQRPPRDRRDVEALIRHTRAVERQNALILTAAGEGIYGLDTDGRTTFVNPAAARMLGWSVEDLIDQPMHAVLHHSHPDGTAYPREQCPIYAAFMDGQVHRVEDEVFWRKDGSSFPVEYTSTPIEEEGRLVGAVVVFWDVTRRKEAEDHLQRALAEVETLKNQLEEENTYLQEEIQTRHNFGEIIGTSPAIASLTRVIETVAPTDAHVLITGESGTGKELVARAVHRLSQRHQRPLIKVNCASIPRELFESEFFGHVRGSFTGAVKDRMGRFQLADRGTLFLDEIGEIPMELQAKLLRVLQEGEFERVGDERTYRVDVRIITATNRDLRQDIDAGRFREDLFYRLNVFPIDVAPLRRRQGDIRLLAAHYLAQASRRFNRPGVRLTQANVNALERCDWPGNVRELQNVIDRAVITCVSGTLQLDLRSATVGQPSPAHPAMIAALSSDGGVIPEAQRKQQERENILAALRQTQWKVYGQHGAAAILGIKPSTLASRIKKLGLKRDD